MSENKILIPIDFTSVSDKVIDMAVGLAKKDNLGVTLLHIETGKSEPIAGAKLQALSQKINDGQNVACNCIIKKGNLFAEIAKVAHNSDYKLMVIGSHGFKGLREKFFGVDILKLVKAVALPVLVIQDDFEMSKDGFKTIVFPAGTHDTFSSIIEATVYFARLFNSTVHLFTVEKPGVEWSDKLKANIELAKEKFEENKISYVRVNQDQDTFSVGYSKQIFKYAKAVHSDLIALMSIPTKEHYYFADSDKESLLTNDAGIPILCSSGEKII